LPESSTSAPRAAADSSQGRPSGTFVRATAPFLLGFNAQVAQLILLRETLILSSGSETALGLCLGSWALLNGAGALFGWMMNRTGLSVGSFFGPLLVILPFLSAGSLHLARISRSFTDVPGGEHLAIPLYVLLTLAIVGPVTFVDGFLFVAGLARLFGKEWSGRDSAHMYGVESSGSLVGGVFFSFLFVFLFDPFTVIGILVGLNALFVPLSANGTRRRRFIVFAVRAILLALAAVLCLKGPALNERSERERWKILQPQMDLQETRESTYQNLALLKYGNESTLFGNGGILFSLRPCSSKEYGDWNRAVYPNFAMLQHPEPERVLLIGGGARGSLPDILLHSPSRVDWVEYDRELISLSERFLVHEEKAAFNDGRVVRHLTDGRYFVGSSPPETYDVIVLDVPDPSNASVNRYYTVEFFRDCLRALEKEGVLVFHMTCQPNFIGKEMLERNGSVLLALSMVFDRVLVTPGELSFVAATGQASEPTISASEPTISASEPTISASELTASADELSARYESRRIETLRFSPHFFYTCFQENEVEWINRIFNDKIAEGAFRPNKDNLPVAYFKDYLLWRRITGLEEDGAWYGFLDELVSGAGDEKPPLIWIPFFFPFLGVLLLIGVFLTRARGKAGAATCGGLFYLTAATVGFNGIVLEMGILLSYQSIAGYLYSRMGIIIAAYMAGLACGALLHFEKKSPLPLFVVSAVLSATGAALALGVTLLPGVLPGEEIVLLVFVVATLVLGASGGLAFRAVSVALEKNGKSPGGVIYSLDILGTCLGGLIAGSVLAPFVGIAGILLLAGGMNVLLPLMSIAALAVRKNEGS